MIKIVNTPKLHRMIYKAVVGDYNCKAPDPMPTLDIFGKHVLAPRMMHNDTHVRVSVMAKLAGSDKPLEFLLDVELAEWNQIPEYKENEDGNRG